MRTSSKNRIIIAALSAFCILMTGCSSGGGGGASDSSKKAVSSLKGTRDQLVKAKTEVRQANAALDKLAAGRDVPQAYKAYTKEVADIKAAGDSARARAKDMNARGREYIANWEAETAQITNPDLKAGAAARRATVKENYEKITAAATSTGDAYRPYLQGLQEIQKALAQDLTPGGVEAAKTAMAKTRQDGEALVQQLDSLIAELDNVSKSVPSPAAGGDAAAK